eukprot:TRINITY_DN25352_c0_g1_i1.p1 TRINITY_DN25352_c0_g1~~TRINITY_DN25352_c0_g1_i1.p1  ORF type:complete len:190 (-),score=4.93 TRINITY_DN25352_c0_g1_i1:298-867(-)
MYNRSHYKKFWLRKMDAKGEAERTVPTDVLWLNNEMRPHCRRLLGSLDNSSIPQVCNENYTEGKESVQSYKRLLNKADPKEENASEFSDGVRSCAICKTEKTPLWRNGPNGPKSLCNACGIRYKKLGKRIDQMNNTRTTQTSRLLKRKKNADGNTESDTDPKIAIADDMDDEERGAVLLMGLSYGLVNA